MKILNKKALSVVEYTLLLVIVIGAFLIMKNYIQRGMFGSWAKTGQSFAFGRQYDSQRTIECATDGSVWYDNNCFKATNSVGSCQTPSCTGGIH